MTGTEDYIKIPVKKQRTVNGITYGLKIHTIHYVCDEPHYHLEVVYPDEVKL